MEEKLLSFIWGSSSEPTLRKALAIGADQAIRIDQNLKIVLGS